MSKQYLTGTLSSSEKYQLEDRLLENDFSFEAMEGLEHVPWEQCERHLLENESRIVEEFSLNRSMFGKGTLIAFAGLLTSALLATWYFTSQSDPVDLSTTEVNLSGQAEIEKSIEEPKRRSNRKASKLETLATADTLTVNAPDTINAAAVTKKTTPNKSTIKPLVRPPPATSKVEIDYDKAVHIAVGRVIDIKGVAIANAAVISGKVTDTTDSHGYFALKVPMGGAQIVVSHLATEYPVEIDTNQNWEIVLDIVNQVVHDYSPMNAANRFK